MFFFWFCFVWSKGAKDGEFIDIYWTLSKNVDYFRHRKKCGTETYRKCWNGCCRIEMKLHNPIHSMRNCDDYHWIQQHFNVSVSLYGLTEAAWNQPSDISDC